MARIKVVRTIAWSIAVSLAASLALVGVVYRLDPAFLPRHAAHGEVWLAALNVLPLLPVVLLLFALSARPLFACWCGALVVLLLQLVNALKLQFLQTPLLPSDFSLGGQFEDADGVLGHYVPTDSAQLAFYALAAAATVLAFVLPLRVRLRPRSRLVLAALAIAFGGSLLSGTPPWPDVYSNERLDFEPWSPSYSVEHAGLIAALLRYRWEFSAPLPEPDRDAAAALVARHAHTDPATPTTPPATTPDIVVLQSESFFDPARLQGIEPEQVAPALRHVLAESTHGDLWVPTYGGGTIRTEFEVLTGVGMRYFPQLQYPYYGLVTPELPALPRLLAAHGYRTLAVHPNRADFWNRAAAFKTMGFEEFDDVDSFADAAREGWYAGDAALVEHVLQRLDAATQPTFVFAISIENHGPYGATPNIDKERRDAIAVPRGTGKVGTQELRDYLYHVDNTDRALGHLVDALKRRSRRTLLLFYGDHLPALPRLYAKTPFDDGRAPTQQPVPYLLFDSADPVERVQDSSAFFLPSRLLARAGIHDPYFELLDTVRAETTFGPDYKPQANDALGALMRMRQLGEWPGDSGAAVAGGH